VAVNIIIPKFGIPYFGFQPYPWLGQDTIGGMGPERLSSSLFFLLLPRREMTQTIAGSWRLTAVNLGNRTRLQASQVRA
jgi:hypothetical protein